MDKSKDTILVTGATGQQGGAVAGKLLDKGYKVRAMTRHPDGAAAKALATRGAEIVQADLDDAASLEPALRGAWGIWAVQNTWTAGVEGEEEEGKRLAELAKKAGIQHYVYTSVASAHRKTGIPHFENKARVEALIRSLGFPSHVILRPVFFMENWTSGWFKPGIADGKLMMALKPDTPLQQIAVEDIGEYGALAFERHEELSGREIDIAGDEHTMPETAEILSRAIGRPVEFQQLPIEAVRQGSADFATMLEWFDRAGYNVHIKAQQRELGVRPTSLFDWAKRQSW